MSVIDDFASSLIGLPINHVWRGHGSAIFLEFGKLQPSGVTRRDGKKGNPSGQMTLMIEWSWRIEGPRSIIAGSWSEEAKWPSAFAKLLKTKVVEIVPLGRLNEIDLTRLSRGIVLNDRRSAAVGHSAP